MNIGQTITKLRIDRGLQQGELAKKAGLTQASLSHIENGNTKQPSKNSLEPICDALGISVAELYIYALDETDFPKKHKAKYEAILPAVKNLMKSIREEYPA